MEEVVDFIRKYLKTEYAARLTVNTDDNADHRIEKLEAVNAFFAEGCRTDITVPRDGYRLPPAEIRERDLFLVKEYQKGKLYAGVLGLARPQPHGKTAYEFVLFVQKQKGGLKATALTRSCPDCAGSAKIDSKPCPECNGNGVVVFLTGKKFELKSFGAPTAVKKLERPTHKRYQPDYDSYK